jgi:hypothetical protein
VSKDGPHIVIEINQNSKGHWEVTFSGPRTGGALKVSKDLKAALKQLTRVLMREFPQKEPKPCEPS